MDPFDRLRDSYIHDPPNAAYLRRELATSLIEHGEATLSYYELLLLEAHYAHVAGEMCRGESLQRRATLIAHHIGFDPANARAHLDAMYVNRLRFDRTLNAALGRVPTRLVQMDLKCALMRFDPATLDHDETPGLPVRIWMLEIGDVDRPIVVEGLFAELNRTLTEPAPHDPNYIGARLVQTIEPRPQTVLAAHARGELEHAYMFMPSVAWVTDGIGISSLSPTELIAIVARN
ncbi:MAG: hypothetical protein QM831_06730 [Kofleriaceae bacterium]